METDDDSPRFLTRDYVEACHQAALEDAGGQPGIRNEGGLESAIAQPENIYYYAQGDLYEIAAGYAYHIAESQAYIDGNKRTAISAATSFLELNGVETSGLDKDRTHDAMIAIANHEMDRTGLAEFFRSTLERQVEVAAEGRRESEELIEAESLSVTVEVEDEAKLREVVEWSGQFLPRDTDLAFWPMRGDTWPLSIDHIEGGREDVLSVSAAALDVLQEPDKYPLPDPLDVLHVSKEGGYVVTKDEQREIEQGPHPTIEEMGDALRLETLAHRAGWNAPEPTEGRPADWEERGGYKGYYKGAEVERSEEYCAKVETTLTGQEQITLCCGLEQLGEDENGRFWEITKEAEAALKSGRAEDAEFYFEGVVMTREQAERAERANNYDQAIWKNYERASRAELQEYAAEKAADSDRPKDQIVWTPYFVRAVDPLSGHSVSASMLDQGRRGGDSAHYLRLSLAAKDEMGRRSVHCEDGAAVRVENPINPDFYHVDIQAGYVVTKDEQRLIERLSHGRDDPDPTKPKGTNQTHENANEKGAEMIIEGNKTDPCRKCGESKNLAEHLQRTDTNEKAEVLELRGFAADDLAGAFTEINATAAGTRASKAAYHAKINPQIGENLTPKQAQEAADKLEKALGFEGQPRALVEHVKEGRQHFHVVWSRVDLEKMKAIDTPDNYRTHERIAVELENDFHLTPTPTRAHERKPEQARPEQNAEKWQYQQAERLQTKTPREQKAEITALYAAAKDGKELQAALGDHGYTLARGDKEGVLLVVDERGGFASLARRVEGAKAADVRAKVSDLDPKSLPTLDQARALLNVKEIKHEIEAEPKAAENARAAEYAKTTKNLAAITREIDGPKRAGLRVVGCALKVGGKAADTVAKVAESILSLFAPPIPRKITPAELWASKEAQRERVAQLEEHRKEGAVLDRMAETIRKDKTVTYADLASLGRESLEELKMRGDDGLLSLIHSREKEHERQGFGRRMER